MSSNNVLPDVFEYLRGRKNWYVFQDAMIGDNDSEYAATHLNAVYLPSRNTRKGPVKVVFVPFESGNFAYYFFGDTDAIDSIYVYKGEKAPTWDDVLHKLYGIWGLD